METKTFKSTLIIALGLLIAAGSIAIALSALYGPA
jgi:hypothetical protein